MSIDRDNKPMGKENSLVTNAQEQVRGNALDFAHNRLGVVQQRVNRVFAGIQDAEPAVPESRNINLDKLAGSIALLLSAGMVYQAIQLLSRSLQ